MKRLPRFPQLAQFFAVSTEIKGSEWVWSKASKCVPRRGCKSGLWTSCCDVVEETSFLLLRYVSLICFKKEKKIKRNTSFYGLMSKKLFRHLKWVMWKMNSLESKAKFVWPQKGRGEREKESLRELKESNNIDFSLPGEWAGETSHWNKFLKLPTSRNVEQQSENKHFYKVCLPRKD